MCRQVFINISAEFTISAQCTVELEQSTVLEIADQTNLNGGVNVKLLHPVFNSTGDQER